MKWADPAQVRDAADDWSDAVIRCRIYGHTWRPLTVVRYGPSYSIKHRCSSCRSEREQMMDLRGYPYSGWHMKYIDPNYLLKNMGRVDGDGRAVLRLAAIRSMKIIDHEGETE